MGTASARRAVLYVWLYEVITSSLIYIVHACECIQNNLAINERTAHTHTQDPTHDQQSPLKQKQKRKTVSIVTTTALWRICSAFACFNPHRVTQNKNKTNSAIGHTMHVQCTLAKAIFTQLSLLRNPNVLDTVARAYPRLKICNCRLMAWRQHRYKWTAQAATACAPMFISAHKTNKRTAKQTTLYRMHCLSDFCCCGGWWWCCRCYCNRDVDVGCKAVLASWYFWRTEVEWNKIGKQK